MDQGKMTPEEKLLKIIENPQTEKQRVSQGTKEGALGVKKSTDGVKKFYIDRNIMSRYLTFQMANRTMAVLCGIITISFIISYIASGTNLNNRVDQLTAEAVMLETSTKKISIPEEDIADIILAARRRNVFTALPMASKEQQDATTIAAPTITNFKLVGIMWSEKPQVMIEDTQEKKTYLLSSGEQIGQFTITKIFRDKVILSIDKQEWELR